MIKKELEDIVTENEKKLYLDESPIVELFNSKKELFGSMSKEELNHLISMVRLLENNPHRIGHSNKVMIYNDHSLKNFGIENENLLDLMKIAAFFHDIGESMLPFKVRNSLRYDDNIGKFYSQKHIDYSIQLLEKYNLEYLIYEGIKFHHFENKTNYEFFSLLALSEVYAGLTSNRADRKRMTNQDEINEILKEIYRRNKFDKEALDVFLNTTNQKHKTKEWPIVYDEEKFNTDIEELREEKREIKKIFTETSKKKDNIKEQLEELLKVYPKENLMTSFAQIYLRSSNSNNFEFDPTGKYIFQILSVDFKDHSKTDYNFIKISSMDNILKRKNEVRWALENKETTVFTEEREEEYVQKGLLTEGFFKRVKESVMKEGKNLENSEKITNMAVPLFYKGDKRRLMGVIRGPPIFPPTETQSEEIIDNSKLIEMKISQSEEINPILACIYLFKKKSRVPQEVLDNLNFSDSKMKMMPDSVCYFSDMRNGTTINSKLFEKGHAKEKIPSIVTGIFEPINTYQSIIIKKFNGYFDKAEHDGAVAAWGVVPKWKQSKEEKIYNSLMASSEIMRWYNNEYRKEVLERYGIILENFAIGLTLGNPEAGLVIKDSLDYTISGEEAIKAARLSKEPNRNGEIWCNEEYAEVINNSKKIKTEGFYAEKLDLTQNIQIKNFGNSEQFYKIIKQN